MATWTPKPPESTEFFPLDLVRHLSKGDRVEACTASIEAIKGADPDAASMLLGDVDINGATVTQKVGGGVGGCRYRLTFTATTFLGETLVQGGDFFVGAAEPGARDLCTLQAAKDWLGIRNTDADALLQRLITFESRTIERAIGRPVLLEARRDTVTGYGSVTLMPPATPIRDVEGVTIDGAAVPANHDDLTLWRRDGLNWPRNARIEIAYTAGLDSVPFDLEQACIELVAFHYREKDRVGMASKGLAGETTAYITRAMPHSVEARLAPYRKVAPV
jgi:hypothetical protein